jgi:3-hydroxyacyl-[acyl-carrier-protein] dehydratase
MPQPIYDLSQINFDLDAMPVAALREANPQRFEFEQVTRIVAIDTQAEVAVGVREIRADEFWVRGHIPGRPLFPGVLMCEAAAQLATFYYKLRTPSVSERFVAFGGLDRVRFRATVVPDDCLILIAQAERMGPRQGIFATQGLLRRNGGFDVVFEARVIGLPLPGEKA